MCIVSLFYVYRVRRGRHKLEIYLNVSLLERAERAAEIGVDSLTHESLVEAVRADSLKRVPDHLKADFLRRIKAVLESPEDKIHQSIKE